MSRRLVSLCILALAGILSFSAARFGSIGRWAIRSTLQLPKFELNETSRADEGHASSTSVRTSLRLAAARLNCADSEKCAAPLSIPMTFEPNVGQFDPTVTYVGRGAGMTLLLTHRGIDVALASPTLSGGRQRTSIVRMRATWTGKQGAPDEVDPRFAWRGEQRLRTVSNYFIGQDPRAWRTDVPHFARTIGASSSGGPLGMAVYGTRGGVEYDLRLAAGTDARSLRLRFTGLSRIELSNGNVILEAGGRELRMAKPRIYDELSGGTRRVVQGGYVMEADGSVGFKIGPHDPKATLVVDPTLSVAYATFLGGTGSETAENVAVGANGNVYVSGATTSASTFPETTASRIGTAVGPSAFYVAKIDPTVTGANSLVYLTFLGGSGTQTGGLIAVDGAGDVALTGTTTSTDFPVTGSSPPTAGLTSGNGNDTVVSEIDAQGNQLNFSAYFGGSGEESANGAGGIAVDSVGNVYIASDTQPSATDPASPDLPVTAGAWQANWDGEASDGFLAVLAPPAQTGGAPSLTYCTYLGTNSTGPVGVGGVAVDLDGNAYIAGSTSNASNGFPVQNAFQSAYGGGPSDGFVMKIAPKGQGLSDLVYATLLGGSGMDKILSIGLDSSLAPKAYAPGETQSTNFPVNGLNAPYQNKLCANLCGASSQNAFLTVIAQDAVTAQTSLAYSSYLGGSETDSGFSIAVAGPGSVYVAGRTNSPDFPWHDNLQPFNGSADAFLAKFDPTSSGAASFIYSTPLGGTAPPGGTVSAAASGVAASTSGQLYLTGQTTAANFPTALTTSGAANGFQQTCTSCQLASPSGDAFLVAIAENSTAGPSVYFNLGSENFGSSALGSNISGQPLAVLNGGDQTLTISDIAVVGPNAGDFAPQMGPVSCIGMTIQPGAVTCTMDVSFTPSIGGPEQAFLAVTDNAPGSPQLLELKGIGNAPHAQVSPTSLGFGNQPINSVSAGQTITITNTGNDNLTLTGDVFSPTGTPFEAQDISCQFPATGWGLAPGASCTMQIAFAPTATGPAQGQVTISDNSDLQSNAQQMVSFSGNGAVSAPMAQVSPTALTFGSSFVGSTSAAQNVVLQNQGSAALDVSGIVIGGQNAADFAISATGTTCPTTGGTVAAAAQCNVAIEFAPQSAGTSKTAALSLTDNDATSPQSVSLSGTATSPPTLKVSPASLAFGSQSEGTTSTAQIVTITNSGSGSASVSEIGVTGSSDFAQQNSCPPVLSAGAQCQVSVSFAPAELAAAGARSGTLEIPGGTPSTVAISGTATQAAVSAAASVNFASQLVGTAGAPQPVTITNSSSGSLAGALAFTGISIGGANRTDFSITANQCSTGTSATVAPGSSCTIQIAFQPQATATCGSGPNRSASLQLQDNATGSPQTIPLSGSAADFCMAAANGQPVTAPIQAGQTATYNLEVASTGGFTGTVNLSCSTAPAGAEIGPCGIVTNPASNPPSVQVTPTAAGPFTVSVPTVAPTSALPRGVPPTWPKARIVAIACAWLLCLFWLAGGALRMRGDALDRSGRLVRWIRMAALITGLAVGMAACGSGGSVGGGNPVSNPGTPPGTYTITVTATTSIGGNSTTRTASLTLTVQ
jgi:hypothetical protein